MQAGVTNIHSFIGALDRVMLSGLKPDSRYQTVPESVFVMFQMTFAIITPALIIGFGNGMEPKILVAIFLVFFPMLVNGMRGLQSADREAGELLHSLSASGFQRLWMVRLPAALPYIFTALKFSACSCFVAAIVAEWVAADRGLGYLIVFESSQYQNALVWAAVIIGTVSSMVLVGLVVALERWTMPWARTGAAG